MVEERNDSCHHQNTYTCLITVPVGCYGTTRRLDISSSPSDVYFGHARPPVTTLVVGRISSPIFWLFYSMKLCFLGLFYSTSDQLYPSSCDANFRPHAAFLDLLARHNLNTPLDWLLQAKAAKNHSPALQTTVYPISKKNLAPCAIDSIYDRP
jgi:hypothetical protein